MNPKSGTGGLPRVLVVSNMYPSDADPRFGSFVADSAAAMRALGAHVIMSVSTDPRRGIARALLKYSGLLVRTIRATLHGGYDVVHAHFLIPTGAIAAIAASARRVPLIVFAHGSDVLFASKNWPLGPLARRVIRRAEVLVAPSHYLAEEIRAAMEDPDISIEVCPMGVDTDLFFPGARIAARADAGLHDDERVALFAGTLDANKGAGCEELLNALDTPELADVRLIVAGEGPWRARLEERSRTGMLTGRVEFRDRVDREVLAELMRAVDLVVVPSRREALGLVALEAQASGTPVVASAVGGLVEHVKPGITGELYESGDVDGLRRELISVLSEPSRYQPAIGTGGHTLSDSARRLLAISAKVAERGGPV